LDLRILRIFALGERFLPTYHRTREIHVPQKVLHAKKGRNADLRFLLVLLLAAAAPAPLKADTTLLLDFEDLPDVYFFSSGDQNIGTYYNGLDFEANVTGLSVSRFGGYDDAAYPPYSGDVVIWDPVDLAMTVAFDSAVQSVGFWYTSYDPLTLQAFDSGSNLLDTTTGDPNTDGTTGTSSYVSVQASGIQSVSVTSTPGLFVMDDFTYQTQSGVPEPNSCALVGIVAMITLLTIAGRHGGESACQCSTLFKQPSIPTLSEEKGVLRHVETSLPPFGLTVRSPR
jgi:hypothetical protein